MNNTQRGCSVASARAQGFWIAALLVWPLLITAQAPETKQAPINAGRATGTSSPRVNIYAAGGNVRPEALVKGDLSAAGGADFACFHRIFAARLKQNAGSALSRALELYRQFLFGRNSVASGTLGVVPWWSHRFRLNL